MYLTAHQVKSPSGVTGVNAFLHLHREQPIPVRGTGEPDLDRVAQLAGGYLIAQSITLQPGGNEVLAHLDLVAVDDVDADTLGRAVSAIRTRVGSDGASTSAVESGVSVRFGTRSGIDLSVAEQQRLLDELWCAGRALLARRSDPPRRATGPLVVWAAYDASGVRLWLPPATLSRLPRSMARRSCMLVPSGLIAESPSEALRESSMTLLGLSEADLHRDGGIEIVDPRTTKTLARYAPATLAPMS